MTGLLLDLAAHGGRSVRWRLDSPNLVSDDLDRAIEIAEENAWNDAPWEVGFAPFVTLHVKDGKIVDAEVDWSDTLLNVYRNGEEVWESSSAEAPFPADIACEHIDCAVCDRVVAALLPQGVAALSDEALQVLAWFVHKPCSEHGRVFAGAAVWDELSRVIPESLVPPEIDASEVQDEPDVYAEVPS